MITYYNSLGEQICNLMNVVTDSNGTLKFGVRSGWVCPKCSTVWSPEVEECWQCNDKIGLEDDEENLN